MGEAIQTRYMRFQQARYAQIEWTVLASSESEAKNSVPFKSGATYPYDALLYGEEPEASRSRDSVGLWIVTQDFWSIAAGHDIMSTLKPGEFGINWQGGLEQVPFGQDGDGNLICNAAGDPYPTQPTKPRTTQHLTITQYEIPSIAHWDKFRETVNAQPVNLFTGAGTEYLPEDTILCDEIQPLVAWKMLDRFSTAPLMPVRYMFTIDKLGHYITEPNIGDRGWFSGTIFGSGSNATYPMRGNFYNGLGNQVTDVLLDLDGTPYDQDQKILCGKDPDTGKSFTPIQAPEKYHVHPSRAVPLYSLNSSLTGLTTQNQGGAVQVGWALKFRRYPAVDMTEVLDPVAQ